jgi:hypothetical protein
LLLLLLLLLLVAGGSAGGRGSGCGSGLLAARIPAMENEMEDLPFLRRRDGFILSEVTIGGEQWKAGKEETTTSNQKKNSLRDYVNEVQPFFVRYDWQLVFW